MQTLKDLKVKYDTKTLSNNIRLDVYEKENSPIEIRFNVLGGDIFNSDKTKKGLTHFVEHIFCAGTKDFPSKDKLALYLDAFGGSVGGITWADKLRLNLGCPNKEDVEKLFQVLGSLLKDPMLNENVIETERGAIVSELNQNKANNVSKVYEKFMEMMYRDTEYQYQVLGPIENIQTINIEDIKNWIKENIVGGKIGICITGDISIEVAEKSVEKYLGFIEKTEIERVELPVSKNNLVPEHYRKEEAVSFVEVKENNSYLKIAHRIGGMYEKDYQIYKMVNDILGGYGRRSGLLLKKLRYETGLSYSPSASFSKYFDTGYFSFEINCKFEDINKVLQIINKIIEEDLEKELTIERFELEQKRFNKMITSAYEKNSEFLNFSNVDTLTTYETDFDRYVKERNEILYEDFFRIGKEFLRNKNWCISYYGKEEVKLVEIVK